MEKRIFEAKTVEEAITEATRSLGILSSELRYEVIEKGSNGVLGLFNKKNAVIEVTLDDYTSEAAAVEAEPVKSKKPEKKKTEEVSVKPVEIETPKTEKKEITVSQETIDDIKAYAQRIFDAMNIKTEITVTMTENQVMEMNLAGEEMGLLIGKRGQTLDSLQYLISLYVNKVSEDYIRFKLDTENYRARRKQTLENLAKNIAYKVKRNRKPVSLEPMNPYERRIIHSALQNDKYVYTKSEGVEPFRKVVVLPKK